jgi:hypothetical protein
VGWAGSHKFARLGNLPAPWSCSLPDSWRVSDGIRTRDRPGPQPGATHRPPTDARDAEHRADRSYPIARPARDQPRRPHHTVHTDSPQLARQHEPARPPPHTSPSAVPTTHPRTPPRRHFDPPTGSPAARPSRDPASPRPPHPQAHQKPLRSYLRRVGTPMIAVPEATPRRQTRAPHARVPTLTPGPDRPAAQDDRPYGLGHEARPF